MEETNQPGSTQGLSKPYMKMKKLGSGILDDEEPEQIIRVNNLIQKVYFKYFKS